MLKDAVEKATGVSPDLQMLVVDGKQLEYGHTMSDDGVEKESVIRMVQGFSGGGKKRKPAFGIVTFEDESGHAPPKGICQLELDHRTK